MKAKKMELLRKDDMISRTKFSKNISDDDFSRNRLLVQENDITPFIGSACLTDILALDRESATDQAKELYSFWQNFVLPYAIYRVYSLFIDTHGYHFAPGGILGVPQGGPQQQAPITSDERSALKKQYERFSSTALTKLKNEFEAKSRTFDGTAYALDDNTSDAIPKAGGMTAVGSVRDKMPYIRTGRV